MFLRRNAGVDSIAEQFRRLLRSALEDSDPEAYLNRLVDDAEITLEEFYLFAHYVRRVASAKASQLVNDDEADLRCSFCLRTRADGGLIVAGLNAAICDRCVEGAIFTIKENRGSPR